MSLRDVQSLFHRLVTAPENVERTMASLSLRAAEVQGAFRGDAALPAVARLDIYADMYFFRIRDVLKEVYERVLVDIGEDTFHNLIVAYLIAHPPRTASIRDAGDRLPEFLRTHELAADSPWLPELAQLEWFQLEVFDAADAPLLELDTLRTTPPDEFGAVPLALVPAHRLMKTQWAVEQDNPHSSADGVVLVWRNGFDAAQRRLEPLEVEALALVAQGTTFGDVCELVAMHTTEEEAPQVAFTFLSRWIADSLISDEQT